MKRVLVLLLMIAPVLAMAQEKIHWMSMDEAIAANAKAPKKFMIDVYTSWCGPCKMMMNTTFKDAKVVKYLNQNYYAVKFNAEGNESVTFKGTTYTNPDYNPAKSNTRNSTHQFAGIAQQEGRLAYPTVVFLDEELNLLTRMVGVNKADVMLPVLHWFHTGEFKSKPFDQFQKEFNAAGKP